MKEKNLSEYIQLLKEVRDKIEKEQDEMMGPVSENTSLVGMTRSSKLEVEFITLGTVIRDLELVGNTQEFSYWNI